MSKKATPLKYQLTNDTLFKILFVQYPELLKRLVSALLEIPMLSITEFLITNPEIPPNVYGGKFSELDIKMAVNNQIVDLEIQVKDEKDYPERSLYYWAKNYTSSLKKGDEYKELPKTVMVSILSYDLFPDYKKGVHSVFEALEVTRHTRLTDRMTLHYFELTKLPKHINADNKLLWLSLFNAKTEEDLDKIKEIGGEEMEQAILAYKRIIPLHEEEMRLKERAEHNEASALANARRKAVAETNAKWEGVLAQKDAQIAALIEQLKQPTPTPVGAPPSENEAGCPENYR